MSDDTTSVLTNVEDIYQDKDLREHIYTLPDTYIGSIHPETNKMWVLEGDKMTYKNLTYIPGFYKIFDEILVNAIDHHVRMSEKIRHRADLRAGKAQPSAEVPSADIDFKEVKNIKVSVDAVSSRITIENDGDGIDIEIHKGLGIYVPQMIFGKLLTSTNYQEDVKRIVGGKNGYGAKLTNIFSKEFVIETVDHHRKRHYIQTFRDNMTIIEEPVITEKYVSQPFTRISFIPDLTRFKLTNGLDKDIIEIMRKRAHDAAACTDKSVSIHWNGQKLDIKQFDKYVDLYIDKETKRVHFTSDRWEICACPSPDYTHVQVSFVNGICTSRGGKHVEHVGLQICKRLSEILNEKNKKDKIDVKPQHIKNNLWLFVKATIENPSFDTQTKECLTSKTSEFGSKCTITDDFIHKLAKTGICERSLALVQFKEKQALSGTDGRKKSKIYNPKLEEGKYVGTSKSANCTLILTEGDSAKTFAMSGLKSLSEEERKYYGVFPLRGKLLNVRDANNQQISKNEEITELKKIIGLQQNSEYLENINLLRYGSVMIITDADVDGDHIKGLLINFFHNYWSSLLQRDDFIKAMITPLVKVWKNKKKGNRTIKDNDTVLDFYSEADYQKWREANNDGRGWQYKYFKGLGTSDAEIARDCFSKMKIVHYKWNKDMIKMDEEELNVTDYTVNLAFKKGFEDSRKEWIQNYDPEAQYNFDISEETIVDFINKRLINFSYEDCIRSIPSVCDGLKISQRKIIYGAFKKGLKSDVKVQQFAGYVAENTGYHHGEASLYSTIVGLAQDYVGANNINLLVPSGQFGTRFGGKDGIGCDYAAPRYIYTRMNDLTNILFDKQDFPLYKYRHDDTDIVEPEYYLPILPVILINGSIGIGTGFSCTVPAFNPLHIIENIKLLMEGKPMVSMTPWYRGFRGDINKREDNCFTSHGIYRVAGVNELEITELPIGNMSFLNYKKFILSILDKSINTSKDGKEKKSVHPLTDKLIDADFDITDTTFKSVLKFVPNFLHTLLESKDKLERQLKLVSNINCTNMHLFDKDNKIKKYNSPEEILGEFYKTRLELYGRRRQSLLDELQFNADKANAKAQFIKDIHSGVIKINVDNKPKKREQLIMDLTELKYPKFSKDDDAEGSYNYLLSMRIDSLTEETLKKLEEERDYLMDRLKELTGKNPEDLWKDDLDKFVTIYDECLDEWYDTYNIPKPEYTAKLIKKFITIKKTPQQNKKINVVKKVT